MDSPTILRVELEPPQDLDRMGFLQRLAGELVWCDHPLCHDAQPSSAAKEAASPEDARWKPVYDGPGLLAGNLERIRSARGSQGSFRVDLEDGETFLIDRDGTRIRRSGRKGPPALDRVLGAPLAIALALRGTYLLHASGIAGPSRGAVALTAESGAGKSTIAAAAAHFVELGLVRVADDILPVRLTPEPLALPRFPQLKLGPEDQYPGHDAIPLIALAEIEFTSEVAMPELVRLGPARALSVLVGATVASKLFDRELLRAHLDSCATALRSLQVFRFRYPPGWDNLPLALETLARLPEAGS